jgi:hypothetical protein
MKRFPILGCMILLSLFCSSSARCAATTLTQPEERDRQVLQTLLLHLLTDPKFDMAHVSTNKPTIVLHERTPDGIGFLESGQIRSEINGRKLPGDALRDLQHRNTPTDAKSGSYDSISAFYTNLTFAAGIVVTDVFGDNRREGRLNKFWQVHPEARGWLEAYLPGYCKNGKLAVVRAGVGPSAHGAMLTAVLEKIDDKWRVRWYSIAHFA